MKKILLAPLIGFCFGVERGVDMLEAAAREGQVYVRGQIVHNTQIVRRFEAKGVIFVDEIDEIPDCATVVFSTHGVAPQVREDAAKKNLTIIDATCPMVAKVHEAAKRLAREGYSIILLGDANHPEVIGVQGEAPQNIRVIRNGNDNLDGIDPTRVALITQTTLNFDDTSKIIANLREKFPGILVEPGMCNATKDRQAAVRSIAAQCDLFIIIGSAQSSNTNKLAAVAREAGAGQSIRVGTPEELDGFDFSRISTIGISSGVSASNELISSIIARLGEFGYAITK